MDIDELLTTTRSVRKALDVDAPADPDVIRDCLRVAMQAPNGSNQQSWRWLVIRDRARRAEIAALYRAAYLQKVGGRLIADLLPEDNPAGRIMSSTEWLVEHLAEVPLFVIPCYEPSLPRTEGDESFFAATLYGSIFPAVWNFQLALHSRGYGSCITTLHLERERDVAELLAIPDTYVQGCLLPVARIRADCTFGQAARRPIDDVVAVDEWEGPPL